VSPHDKATVYIATTRYKFDDHTPSLFKSTDYGNTWTGKDSMRNWYSVSISSNGEYQTAVAENGQIYISTTTQDASANSMAIYDTSNATVALAGGAAGQNGLDASCNVLLYDSSNNCVYVGGAFRKVSDLTVKDQNANYVAIWNNTTNTWSDFGTDASNGLNNFCNALALDVSNQVVYVGGNFTRVRDVIVDQSANFLAAWNLNTNRWSKVLPSSIESDTLNGPCNTLAFDNSNSNLYIGGNFFLKISSDISNVIVSQNYTNNLFIWYTFDTNSISGTTVVDNMGNYNGTLVNGATIDLLNKRQGNASLFLNVPTTNTRANYRYVQLPTLPPSLVTNNVISFAFWFRATSNTVDGGRIFDFANSEFTDGIGAFIVNGNLGVSLMATQNPNVYPNVIDNVWRHCVWVLDNTTWRVYINGVMVQTQATTVPVVTTRTINNIGLASYTPASYYNGNIDDFRVYREALTQDKIMTIYNYTGNIETATLNIGYLNT
jgi:hypothetical protein